MTDDQMRIAIAEACGWKRHDEKEVGFGGGERITTGWLDHRGIHFRKLPDYLTDLNAMHEAITQLSDIYYASFLSYLELITKKERQNAVCAVRLINEATARQRAEAFLRTLNLWTT